MSFNTQTQLQLKMKISIGIPTEDRNKAAELYWQAFGGKLGRVMAPTDKALAFIGAVVDPNHVIAAYDDGALVGVAGFKSNKGAFVGGDLRDLIAVYGVLGGIWRGLTLELLSRDTDNTRFLMDGLCVDAAARGRGVGSALLEAVYAEARHRGYEQVRLDVVEANDRARALYLRHGFIDAGTYSIWPLHRVFGFRRATTMVRDLGVNQTPPSPAPTT